METSEKHDNLIEILRKAWESLDADMIEPLLAEDIHYSSWWTMVELHSKKEYLAYIKERFQTYSFSECRPLVKTGINKNDGERAVALQFGEGAPTLIRIKERDGLITEMWMQSAE